MANMLFKKGSPEQKQMKTAVMIFIASQDIGSLSKACEKVGYDYQLIYGQLSGQRICQTETIEKFIKLINPSFRIAIMNSKPVITCVRK